MSCEQKRDAVCRGLLQLSSHHFNDLFLMTHGFQTAGIGVDAEP